MKIKCVNNQYSSLPENITKKLSDADFFVNIGKQYTVYAITEYYESIWYCIFDENSDSYPMWLPSNFFEIIDNRLSRYWVFSFFKKLSVRDRFFFGFSDWAKNIEFYSNLVEGEDLEVSLFGKYRKAMDLEFPDSSVTESAQIGDEKWLICPQCMDAWEYPDDKDALVICPMCTQVYNNPRYKNEMPVPK